MAQLRMATRRRHGRRDREDDLVRGAVGPGYHPNRPAGSYGQAEVGSLQRLAGNRAVISLLAPVAIPAKAAGKGDHKPAVDFEDVLEDGGGGKGRAKLAGGGPAGGVAGAGNADGSLTLQRFSVTGISEGKMFEYKAGQVVQPDFPLWRLPSKRSNTDSSTTTPATPKLSGTVAWDAASSAWRFQVDSIRSPGKIQLVYYSMRHYPAPFPNDDEEPLFNVKKSNWRDIVTDLRANRTGMGGDWSAYMAEDLHEDYHWFNEWIPTMKPRFTAAQNDIAQLSVRDTDATGNKVSYWDARKTLRQQAKQAFTSKATEGSDAFWALGDSPGDPPYQAQARAVDYLIGRVRDKATDKNWG